MNYLITLICCISILSVYPLQAQPACDKDKQCIGRAVQMTETYGRGAHFIEVSNFGIRDKNQKALTVEMWGKLTRVNNTRQYLGGIWGPATDNNDVWQLFIDQNNDLVFEINGDGTKLKSVDNTILRTPFSQYFGIWTHIAAIFDGNASTISLFINGELVAGPFKNDAYPASYLRPTEKSSLKLLFGSINGLSDNTSLNRTFKGQLDEIRMWNRVVSPLELLCNSNKALAFNEPGLQLYYRCNEAANIINLCDASGKGNTGIMLSGTSCQPSDRKKKQFVTVSPNSITEDIRCEFRKSYQFTITDTSKCGSNVSFRMENIDKSAFTVSPTSAKLDPNSPVTITVTVQTAIVGAITADLQIIPGNDCGQTIVVPLRFNRKTQLSYARATINLDTLYAGCAEQKYKDTIIKICNSSDSLGSPENVTLTNFITGIPGVFKVISPALPYTIKPGECKDIVLRFTATDTSAAFFDTLKVLSTDKCVGGIVIPLRGIVREIVTITDQSGKKKIDSTIFGTECIGTLSNPIMWVWKNLTSRPVFVDSVKIPNGFTARKLTYPLRLDPNTGYSANYFRFFPNKSGFYNDSIIFYFRIQGVNCTYQKKIYTKGRGYEAKVKWTVRMVDVGNAIVGQQKQLIASIKNDAPDTLFISYYLEVGEVFFFPGGKSTRIAPGQTVNVPIDFKPLKDSQYVDRLCLFEQRCYTNDCIEITGKGILETFEFDPIFMRTENVLGCGDRDDTLDIINISGSTQRLTNFTLTGGSGKYTVKSPIPLPTDTTFEKDQRLRFIFNYMPNDPVTDRADRAYLNFSSTNVKWTAPLYGTSATPKIYVTPLTVFGTLEVGDSVEQKVLIENVSFLPVRIDSVLIPKGFTLISISRSLPDTLNPRDSIMMTLRFKPDSAKTYDEKLSVYSQFPCPIIQKASLRGRGIIVPLEAPISLMNWSYVRPCDCISRNLPLVNQSLVHEMIVDSLFIDSVGIMNGTPQFWRWTSTYSPKGTIPYAIPKESTDTVRLTFCPRTPAEDKYIVCAANLKIKAHGSGWQRNNYLVSLAGKRALTYKPEPIALNFPPTPVDTSLNPLFIKVTIPSIDKNPEQYNIVVDSISFVPDERVFTYTNANGSPFVRDTIFPGDTTFYRINFKPRAPRNYSARVNLHLSKPCGDIDTTIFITGNGQANPFGLSLSFDSSRASFNSFTGFSCDTIRIPVQSSRDIPAELIDITCRIGHDNNELLFTGIESPYLSNTCFQQFPPSYTSKIAPTGGTQITVKNFCKVDSAFPFMIAKFVSKTGNRVTLPITVDSISFDTEKIILYSIYAEPDNATVKVLQPEITVLNPVNFDSVRILDCTDRTFMVKNIGDMPVKADKLLNLNKDIQYISSVPSKDSLLAVGDTLIYTIRYCPTSRQNMYTSATVQTSYPCPVIDSSIIQGFGYAPEIPIAFSMGNTLSIPDTIKGTLNDTISIPLMIEDDMSVNYKGITHFLKAVSMNATLKYNARALKFIDASSTMYPSIVYGSFPGTLDLFMSKADSLKKGVFANARFVITVPDSISTIMHIFITSVTTDSLPFMEVMPLQGTSPCIITGECLISTMKYTTILPTLSNISPNPVSGKASISYSFPETTPYTLSLYSSDGKLIKVLASSISPIAGGNFTYQLDAEEFSPGVYYYVLEAGIYRTAKKVLIVR